MESIKGMKLNKGEWAEFYVFLKLLGDGKLYTADNLLKKNWKNYLDILSIIRQEISDVIEYVVDGNAKKITIESKSTTLATISMQEFENHSKTLFDNLKNSKGNSIPAPASICDFAKIIYVTKPKAPAVKALEKEFGGKNDIIVKVRDSQTAIVSVMGFSIKSKFASNPTLFNASASSPFLYKVENCDDGKMKEFNNIFDENGHREWKRCKNYFKAQNMSLSYKQNRNSTFDNNLFLVGESMGKILAWCAEDRLFFSESDFEVKETVERMIAKNPLSIPNPKIYYEKVAKDLLIATFTGMTAAKEWDGREQVNGGYIVVMEDGDVLCYHSSDREAFRDYLYRNTHFEYVDSKKFKWSYIEKIGNEYFIPLNISIRFNTKTR